MNPLGTGEPNGGTVTHYTGFEAVKNCPPGWRFQRLVGLRKGKEVNCQRNGPWGAAENGPDPFVTWDTEMTGQLDDRSSNHFSGTVIAALVDPFCSGHFLNTGIRGEISIITASYEGRAMLRTAGKPSDLKLVQTLAPRGRAGIDGPLVLAKA